MALTYYDMEKLMRMMYDQKLSARGRKIRIARGKVRDFVPHASEFRAGFVRAEPRRNKTVCCYPGE